MPPPLDPPEDTGDPEPIDLPIDLDPPPKAADPLEPIAEDLHHLMGRVHAIERGQAELRAQVEAVVAAVADNTRAMTFALDRMHRELLGDRRVVVDRQILAALAPALDALRELEKARPADEEGPMGRQLAALIGIATNALQRAGFVRFEPAINEVFDSMRMEAFGTAEGPPGRVLGVLRCGYLYNQRVERTAGVLIGPPEIRDDTDTDTDTDIDESISPPAEETAPR